MRPLAVLRRIGPRLYLASIAQVALVFGLVFVGLAAGRPPDARASGFDVLAHALAELWDRPAARDGVLAQLATTHRAEVTLVDATGEVVAHVDARPDLATPSWPAMHQPVHGPGGARLGTLSIVEPRPEPPRGRVLALGLGALLLLAAAATWLSRSLVRPLARLGATAEAFGRGQLAARTGLGSDDEIGRLARTFDEMAARIQSLVHQQSELLGNVSHELRTPLARMRVALDLAASGAALDPEIMDDLARDVGELAQLVEDLLGASRHRLHGGAPSPEQALVSVDVAELVRDAARRFALRHPGRALAVTAPPTAVLRAMPTLLRRALDNLLDNAAKYSRDDAPIRLSVEPGADALELHVRDEGLGMSPEELSRACEPFYRAERSRARATGGVGLGLAFAKLAIEAQGGRLVLRSELGRGTDAALVLRRSPA